MPASYSNSGEVMADGSYEHNNFVWRGTSFAAPLISLEEAFFLLTGGHQTCEANVPPLGYADFEHQKQQWNNMSLDKVIGAFCPQFNGRTASPAVSPS